jgi:hypothetical protein
VTSSDAADGAHRRARHRFFALARELA